LLAGENPPPGALVDYYLPNAADGAVTLDVLNGQGKIIRTYSSTDPVRSPDPAPINCLQQNLPADTHGARLQSAALLAAPSRY